MRTDAVGSPQAEAIAVVTIVELNVSIWGDVCSTSNVLAAGVEITAPAVASPHTSRVREY